MPRPLRVEYPGAMYHVMSRGDRREAIFEDEKDRQIFLTTLGEACGKTGWEVHAYVLMSNRFHLVMESSRVLNAQRSRHDRNDCHTPEATVNSRTDPSKLPTPVEA